MTKQLKIIMWTSTKPDLF